jgi:DNA-directed RNA polymerase specialized sigma24 family protein
MGLLGSVTQLLSQLRSGDSRLREEAAAEIWRRYCDQLLELACQKLNERLRRRVGGEDISQAVFKSFFFRHQRGDYSLKDRNELMHLLIRMTLNKSRGAAKRESRQRRDYRRDQTNNPTDGAADEENWLIEQAIRADISPADAAILAEEAEQRLKQLPEDLRRIALLKLEGHSNEAMSSMPGIHCAVRTVERKLRLIRELWGAAKDENDVE